MPCFWQEIDAKISEMHELGLENICMKSEGRYDIFQTHRKTKNRASSGNLYRKRQRKNFGLKDLSTNNQGWNKKAQLEVPTMTLQWYSALQ